MNGTNYKLVIMAAGRGERLMPLTNTTPKPLLPINSEQCLIDKIIDGAIESSIIEDIYVTVGYKKDEIISHLSKYKDIKIIDTSNKSNVWWIFNTDLAKTSSPIIITTADILCNINYDDIIKDYNKLNRPIGMLVPTPSIPEVEGDYLIGFNNKITDISRSTESEYYASGIQVIDTTKINMICKPQDNFNSFWQLLISDNNLYYSNIILHNWFSVDTIDNYNKIKKL